MATDAFLVRKSSKPGDYALSVWYVASKQMEHVLIRYNNGWYCEGDLDRKVWDVFTLLGFPTIPELLDKNGFLKHFSYPSMPKKELDPLSSSKWKGIFNWITIGNFVEIKTLISKTDPALLPEMFSLRHQDTGLSPVGFAALADQLPILKLLLKTTWKNLIDLNQPIEDKGTIVKVCPIKIRINNTSRIMRTGNSS
jgi:hypothetical protein